MREGVPTGGEDFFDLLRADEEFCAALGRAVLAGSRLETRLTEYLVKNGADGVKSKDTLGRLVDHAERTGLLLKWVPALRMLVQQRNYLVHNVHPLFAGAIEETILPRSDLLDSDVDSFTDRAWQLTENLDGLAQALKKYTAVPNKSS